MLPGVLEVQMTHLHRIEIWRVLASNSEVYEARVCLLKDGSSETGMSD